MISVLSVPAEVCGSDPEIGMTELPPVYSADLRPLRLDERDTAPVRGRRRRRPYRVS